MSASANLVFVRASVGPTFFGLLGLEVGDLVVRSEGLEVVAALEVVEAGDELVGELGRGVSCLGRDRGAGRWGIPRRLPLVIELGGLTFWWCCGLCRLGRGW